MKKYSATKHLFTPRHLLLPQFGVNVIYGKIRFTEESKYETTEFRNQADWNKGGGLSHSIIPNRNAVMIGWRYLNNKFELTPYLNIDSANIFRIFNPVTIEMNKDILWSIEFRDGVIHFDINGNEFEFGDYEWRNFSFPRMPYFGGDDTPTKPVSIFWQSSNT